VIVENVHKFSFRLFGNFVCIIACIGSCGPGTFLRK